MTGEQIIGAAGVIAGRIVSETAKDMRETNQTIRKELVTAAKDTETFKQAANMRAKRIAVKETLFLQMFRPIRKAIGLSAEYFELGFEDDMKSRVKAIPEEHRVDPKPSIAAPAMQGLAVSLDEPELKKLYLDLLASASDDRRSKSVHPAFVEVIRQLSAEEIPILAYPLGSRMVLPMARVVGKAEGGGQFPMISHLTEQIACCPGLDVATEMLPTYVDNWVRLGLVEVVYGEKLARPGAYAWIDRRIEAGLLRDTNKDGTILSVETQSGILRPTSFGYAFAKAVGMEISAVYLEYINRQVRTARGLE